MLHSTSVHYSPPHSLALTPDELGLLRPIAAPALDTGLQSVVRLQRLHRQGRPGGGGHVQDLTHALYPALRYGTSQQGASQGANASIPFATVSLAAPLL